MIVERACRVVAIVIAILAVVDPAWIVARTAPARVVVSQADGASDADVARVKAVLSARFEMEPEASPATAARVMVGRHLPVHQPEGRTFVVTPDPPTDAPDIRDVRVGDEVFLNAIGRVSVRIAVPGSAASRAVAISLMADGIPVDGQEVAVPAGVSTASADLLFVPSRAGLARLRVAARLGDGPEVYADAATEVTSRRLRVLSYDPRPSWAATFLRRALEDDPRFEVVVRAMTSRGVAADAGAPPATLDRAEDLADFDVVVVSAPEALGERATAALEAYLRQREGAVVLLAGADEAPVLSRLTGVPAWTGERRPALERVESGAGAWTASEFLWPAVWPAGAEALTGCLAPGRCAVWRVPVGGGRVVVSSALDGWRTRAVEASGFASFWRSLVGDEAAQTPRPVEVSLASRLVETGALVSAEVRTTDLAVRPRAEWQNTEGAVQPVRLWPAGAGRHRAEFRAPDVPGRYRLLAEAGPSSRVAAEFLVVDPGTVHRALPEGDARLAAYASSRGGEAMAMSAVDALPDRLAAAVGAAPVSTETHPMRSPWWIVPFAGFLAVEWWSRRRRGAR